MRILSTIACILSTVFCTGTQNSDRNCSEGLLKWKLLNNKYTVEKLIGSGGNSNVFLAAQTKGPNVALKCIIPGFELQALRLLSHKNIIKVVDDFYDPISDQHYLATELCQLDLHQAIFFESLKYDTFRIFSQILDAVTYLHQNQIYHGDLKPGNILLTSRKDQVVKIADFGAATRSIYFSGIVLTTTEYAAPEIFYPSPRRSRPRNAANDVWSLGVILFNLLTRTKPWLKPPTDFSVVDTFKKKYRFSNELMAIFKKVFTDSNNRVTVQELKDAFLEAI